MTIYTLTLHHLEDGHDEFANATFSNIKAAREALRRSFAKAVKVNLPSEEDRAQAEEEDDIHLERNRAWLTLSHNEQNEWQWNITRSTLDNKRFSASAYLD